MGLVTGLKKHRTCLISKSVLPKQLSPHICTDKYLVNANKMHVVTNNSVAKPKWNIINIMKQLSFFQSTGVNGQALPRSVYYYYYYYYVMLMA
jgi:hypothetical protein